VDYLVSFVNRMDCQAGNMPRHNGRRTVVIFFTGGTITMRPRPDERGVVPSNEFDRLFAELRPYVSDVDFKPVLWSNLPSPT